MRLFNLVEQQHGIRCLANGISQQTTVLITHITRRRANQLGNGMLLCIFAHVEAYQFNTQFLGQHASHLRLTHTRKTDKEQ